MTSPLVIAGRQRKATRPRAWQLALLALLALAPRGWADGLPPEQEPGARVRIDPADLPLPYATDSPTNRPEKVPEPSLPPLRLPPGFTVNAFAAHLTNPRWMTVAPNGDVFLAETRADKVTLLRDADGDGRAELVTGFVEGLHRPHGLAIQGDWLYVADVDGVWRLHWRPGMTQAEGTPQAVTAPGALGRAGNH